MLTWSKTILLTLAAGIGITLGCGDLDEALLDAECYGDEDCGNLACNVVALQLGDTTFNAARLGWCAESAAAADCKIGEQPYCQCDLAPNPACSSPYYNNRVVQGLTPCQDPNDVSTCFCLPVSEAASCPWTN